jgi:hypothetical protein
VPASPEGHGLYNRFYCIQNPQHRESQMACEYSRRDPLPQPYSGCAPRLAVAKRDCTRYRLAFIRHPTLIVPNRLESYGCSSRSAGCFTSSERLFRASRSQMRSPRVDLCGMHRNACLVVLPQPYSKPDYRALLVQRTAISNPYPEQGRELEVMWKRTRGVSWVPMRKHHCPARLRKQVRCPHHVYRCSTVSCHRPQKSVTSSL